MTVIENIAQAMADYENEHRYELTSGSQSTGVEPYEASAEDFDEIAAFVAERLQGAVSTAGEVVSAWDQWLDYLSRIGVQLQGHAPFAEAMERLRSEGNGQ